MQRSGVFRYLARRFGLVLMTLWIVTVVIFGMTELMPGDAAQYMLGQNATETTLAALRARLGLDQPAHIRYWRWLSGAVRGDLGYSIYLNGDISPVLAVRLKNSTVLAVMGFLFSVPMAIMFGVLAGVRENRPLDRVLSVVSLILLSLPEFVAAVLVTLVLSTKLGLLPPSSMMDVNASPWQELDRLVLPALTMALGIAAYILRMTRASVVDVMKKAYIRTAKLKGIPWREVVFKHGLRNALLPTVTVVFNCIGWMVGGLVIVETFFAYPGLSRLVLAAVEKNDFPLLQAAVLVVAVITLAANLTADLTYAALDPRIRL